MKQFCALFLLLAPVRMLHAQIELPEFVVPEEERHSGSTVVGPEGQRHVDPDGKKRSREADEEIQAEADRMLRRMQKPNARLQLLKRPGKRARPDKEQTPEEVLSGGPLTVSLRVATTGEGSKRFAVPNQTVIVATTVGPVPFRLHEVKMARFHKQGSRISAELHNGDAVEGAVEDFHLLQERLDGQQRIWIAREISHFGALVSKPKMD